MNQDKIYGLTLDDCARIMAKDTALRAEHGEQRYKPYFHQFLSTLGTNTQTWAESWNAWHTRMESDPSGRLYAEYASYQQQHTLQAHMSDVPNMSADLKGGLSLEAYAEISAGIAGGLDYGTLLQKHGIDNAGWQRAQTAWTEAMAADVNHHITTQYGQLYAKYTPGFQQNMQAQTASIMAGHYAERAAGIDHDEPEEEYTFAQMRQELDSPAKRTRWAAAHHVMNQWDIADEVSRQTPPLSQAIARAYELSHEALETHDEFTVSEAEALGQDLLMLAGQGYMNQAQASDSKGAIARCLNRAKSQLGTLQAAFAPIAHQAVPERVKMQATIQDHESMVDTFESLLEEWDDEVTFQSEHASASSSQPSSPSTHTPQPHHVGGLPAAPREQGILDILRKLPIIGPILRMLGI